MKVEVLDSPIIVDGKPVVKNLRVNMDVKNIQSRIKLTLINNDGTEKPVDLVVYSSKPVFDKFSIVVSATGREMVAKVEFAYKLQFNLLKRECMITGVHGKNAINKKISNVAEIGPAIRDILQY